MFPGPGRVSDAADTASERCQNHNDSQKISTQHHRSLTMIAGEVYNALETTWMDFAILCEPQSTLSFPQKGSPCPHSQGIVRTMKDHDEIKQAQVRMID